MRQWLWLLPVCTALVTHLGGTYDPFPAVPGLGDPPASWWWVSLAVAVAAALGAFRLMRALGVEGALLPLAMTIGATGVVGALAARSADGPSGAGFGMEALALCLLLWCYDAFVRGHAVRAGVLLGGASLAHPLMLAHGLITVGLATSLGRGVRWRRFGVLAAIALAAGAPAVIHLGVGITDILSMDNASAARVIADGYLFRYPSTYTMRGLFWQDGVARVLVALAGLAAAVWLIRAGREAARALAGLIAGHALLAGLAVLCYTRRLPGPWTQSVTAYALDLTLTSPLLPLLSGIAIMAAIETQLAHARNPRPGPPVLRVALWAAAATLLATIDWSLRELLAGLLGVVALAAVTTGRGDRVAAAVLALAALAVVGDAARRGRPHVAVDPSDAQLYQWARSTHKRAGFIVPPTARSFRYYTRRGVYVDYDLVPPASPRSMLGWRERMELVSSPDARIGVLPAWQRPYAMDRAFAIANTPARAAELLTQVGTDYLVWDATGLAIPPYLPVDRPPDQRVAEVFRNDRYVVYALVEASSDRP
jgi:hypothetical protein